MKAVKDLHGVLDGLESKHITQILGLKDKESGKKIHLPKKLYAQKEYNKVIVGIPKLRKQIEIAVDTERDFLVIGNLLVKIRTETQFDLSKLKPDCEVFDLDGLEPPLVIRSKRDGDFIVTKIGRKKVKNIFQDRKTPLHRRKEIMMLCDKTGILWVIGIARSSRAFIRKSTKKILVVSFAHSN
jgi:tRNA(Ile)-lysidine synthase